MNRWDAEAPVRRSGLKPNPRSLLRLALTLSLVAYWAPPAANSMSRPVTSFPAASFSASPYKASKPVTGVVLPGAARPMEALVTGSPEQQLVSVLRSISQADLKRALRQVDQLLAVYPNYRLAHLIKGDLLLAQGKPLGAIGQPLTSLSQEEVNDLKQEALVRLRHHASPAPADLIPKQLLQITSDQKYVLAVDTARSRMYVYRNQNNQLRYVSDFYITIGKRGSEKQREGDQRTPLGVYFVTSELPRDKLADLYGDGAFPLNYPNEWDRRQGKTGYGIWLHGTPRDTYARPPLASNGCVVLTNEDLNLVRPYLQVGTPVVIGHQLEWVSQSEVNNTRSQLQTVLDGWRRDWESLDTNRYLNHYATTFRAPGADYTQWRSQKAAVNASKQWVKVRLSEVSIFSYPGDPNLAVVTFTQEYQSNNLQNRMKKRQYWQRDKQDWKIVYEGAA